MSDFSTKDKDKDITDLEKDIEDYCWNYRELADIEKQDIKALYLTWKKALNNKIIIEDIHKTNIRVSDDIICNNKILWKNVSKENSLHFLNCSDITIVITPKVNHVTVERSQNINLRVVKGSISGLDLIKCDNVITVLNSGSTYFIDISTSNQCSFIFCESVAKNIMITTQNSHNINFKVVADLSGITKNVYKINLGMFQEFRIYSFHLDDNEILGLYITIPEKSDMSYLVLPTNN